MAGIKKGRPVNEADIPPPVAAGAPSAAPPPAVPRRPAPPAPSPPEPTASVRGAESEAAPEIARPSSEEEPSSPPTLPPLIGVPSPEEGSGEPDGSCEPEYPKLN